MPSAIHGDHLIFRRVQFITALLTIILWIGGEILTLNDTSWQINDALFDRYYLSGMAPDYSINTNGYAPSGTLADSLSKFYSTDSSEAQANPALRAYLPEGDSAPDVVDALSAADGYKKMGAYSLIQGAFNVNSTSVDAWAALLRGNKSLAITSQQATNDSADGTPFPLAAAVSDTNSQNGWEQFSRLSDDDIEALAEAIVEQVKARGPFMSLSDFVNRRIGNDSRSNQGPCRRRSRRRTSMPVFGRTCRITKQITITTTMQTFSRMPRISNLATMRPAYLPKSIKRIYSCRLRPS